MTVPGLTEAIGVDDLVGAIEVLTAAPTPRGRERATASALAEWANSRWPSLSFSVDSVGATGANLVCCAGTPSPDDLLIYSHLDTSLTGFGATDHPVTGSWADAATGCRVRGDSIAGFGLGVARGPAAAALVGFVGAATTSAGPRRPLRLVLAGGGTHENSIPDAQVPKSLDCGLATHLAEYPLPGAAVIAKAGPRGILWDEPGAGYLRLRVRGRRGAVLTRDLADPPGGLPSHVGEICAAVETWRDRLQASAIHGGQAGREVGIGAIRAGSTRKPDLLPAFVDLYLYVVMVAGDVLGDLADDLTRWLQAASSGGPLQHCVVEVEKSTSQDAGVTDPESAVVRTACDIWERHHGERLPVLSGWTGSTDGVLLRGSGVETIRTGPASVTDDNDPAWDAFRVTELLRFARIYAEIGASWATGATARAGVEREGRGQ